MCIALGILYYSRKMPKCLLKNWSMQCDIINGAKTLVFIVILNFQDNIQIFKSFNIVYSFSFLYMTK